MFKNAIMALGILIAGQTQAASSVDALGIQVIKGEAAYAIYNAIPGSQSPVESVSQSGQRKLFATVKEVAQLSCLKTVMGVRCYVSEKAGQNPVDINGDYINEKIYRILDTRTIVYSNATTKTVAQILCSQAASTAEFSCNIHFRK